MCGLCKCSGHATAFDPDVSQRSVAPNCQEQHNLLLIAQCLDAVVHAQQLVSSVDHATAGCCAQLPRAMQPASYDAMCRHRLHCLCASTPHMQCVILQMQDVAHNCQGQYNLLAMAQCADTASTPSAYTVCNGSCSAGSGNHYVYSPWGSCSASCDGGTQTRTGGLLFCSVTTWLLQCAMGLAQQAVAATICIAPAAPPVLEARRQEQAPCYCSVCLFCFCLDSVARKGCCTAGIVQPLWKLQCHLRCRHAY